MLTTNMKNICQHATQWKILFAEKVVVSTIELAKRWMEITMSISINLGPNLAIYANESNGKKLQDHKEFSPSYDICKNGK